MATLNVLDRYSTVPVRISWITILRISPTTAPIAEVMSAKIYLDNTISFRVNGSVTMYRSEFLISSKVNQKVSIIPNPYAVKMARIFFRSNTRESATMITVQNSRDILKSFICKKSLKTSNALQKSIWPQTWASIVFLVGLPKEFLQV